MRMFISGVEAFKEMERDLWEMGTLVKGHRVQAVSLEGKKAWTKELLGYSYSIPITPFAVMPFSQLAETAGYSREEGDRLFSYSMAEFADRLASTPTNPGNAWLHRPDYWQKYLNKDSVFSYTYSERMAGKVSQIIGYLRKDLYTRQAVIAIWDAVIDENRIGSGLRIPCSMHYQVLIRDENEQPTLNVIYSMRSCDLYTHFIVDQTLASVLGWEIAERLGVKTGRLIHQFGSLHAFYPDLEKRGIF